MGRMYLQETFRRIESYKLAKSFIEEFFETVASLEDSDEDEDICANNAELILCYYLPRMKENGLELYDKIEAELENKCLSISWKYEDPHRYC